ncbi:alpha-glutamyl/putrescinyl thymine pyrophosphorylase clade 3 protein [Mucilaginibacter sp. KACC 22063]|uniref:alpha-glutamyl/putrescinyl thymine pyrophosphorylase clade 3 protein n=1 Tax=Mucilaginibacter sp. KACC 22063 TaxID=3025666 RepID=UPI0023673A79|nr:hypothetical protein [Mucilaginibacter sp. KACC 22063]WDF55243.1 hypothetical protein PQ461_20125 [Mucilaginibacter sp. KACC 22063]
MDSHQIGQLFMRLSRDIELETSLVSSLKAFQNTTPLLGIANQPELDCFVKQLVDSVRRIQYVTTIRDKINTPSCVNPNLGGFNPIKAAAFHHANGNSEEASWLVFLATHFGKNKASGWQLLQDVYGTLGMGIFDWQQACQSPRGLGIWIDNNKNQLKANGGNFGNHRKYQSLKVNNTGQTISSYIDWIGKTKSHLVKFLQLEPNQANPKIRFRAFYNSMLQVYGFGRTAVFDYLTMMGKLQLIDVEPDSVYMIGATGPFKGGRLLFTGSCNASITRRQMDRMLSSLNQHLGIPFGMQVLEDALCNWQKSPNQYIYFSG